MDVILWLIVFIICAVATGTIRVWLAVRKQDNKKLNFVSDVVVYTFIISALIVSIVISTIYKTPLAYMYICSAAVLLIMNVIITVVIYIFRHKEL